MEVVRPSASYRAGGVTSSIERGARDGVVWHVLFAPQKRSCKTSSMAKVAPVLIPLRRADDSAEAAREKNVKYGNAQEQ